MKHKFLPCLLFLAILISGCSLPLAGDDSSESLSSPRAWFDAPLLGTVFYPPNPCQIVAHGASPNGIALFELSINGAARSIPSPDTQGSLVTLTQDCGLTEPGDYLLLLRARDNDGNWSGIAETTLTIAGRETPTVAPPSEGTTATVSPTVTTTPIAAMTGGASIESLSTKLVYLGQTNCGPNEVTITTRAAAPKGIKVVVLFYRFQTGGSSEFQSVSMNSIGGDLYQRTLNPTSLLGGSIPFDQAVLEYQVVIQQNDGDISLRTPLMFDITVRACGSVTVSCSSYTDEQTCVANGCSWVAGPGIFPVYECRNP